VVGAAPNLQDIKEKDHQKVVERIVTTRRTAATKRTEVGVTHPRMKKRRSKEQLI
jgi:hypothetical protein